MNKNNILRALKWIWVIAVLIFVGIYFYKNLPEGIEYMKSIQIKNIIWSVLLMIIGKMAVIELARKSVSRAGWTPSYTHMLSVVTISQLGKYIPGGVWHFAARVNAYKENSLSYKKTAKVMVIENIWLVSGALFFGLFMLMLQSPANHFYSIIKIDLPSYFWRGFTFALPVFWVITLLILERFFPSEERDNALKRVILLMLTQIVIWSAIGSSFFFVFQDIGSANYFFIVGGYALSWVAGYVIIFAPGGIGIREFVLVALFSSFMPTSQIAIYTVVHRLIYTFVEVLMGGVGFFLKTRHPEHEKEFSGNDIL